MKSQESTPKDPFSGSSCKSSNHPWLYPGTKLSVAEPNLFVQPSPPAPIQLCTTISEATGLAELPLVSDLWLHEMIKKKDKINHGAGVVAQW